MNEKYLWAILATAFCCLMPFGVVMSPTFISHITAFVPLLWR